MRRLSAAVFVLALCAFSVPVGSHASGGRTDLSVSTGRRTDDVNWNIAGLAPSPYSTYVNVLSELAWSDVESQEVRLLARVLSNRYVLKGRAGYGVITGGANQDSDFGGLDRASEFSRSNNSSDDGTVWDLSGAVGYLFEFPAPGGSVELTPLVGASYSRQNLTITDGLQTVATSGLTPPLGPIAGLDSTYKAGWGGPWAGVDLSYQLKKMRFFGSFEYHYVNFDAQADWNLRSDFSHPVSFEHWATGKGVVFSAGVEYNLSRQWSFLGSFMTSDFQATDGTDRTYFSSGAVADTPLNEVNWESMSGFFGFNFRF